MEEVKIYKFQLKKISEALRLTANYGKCRDGITCYDRIVRQAEQYAKNALEGEIDKIVKWNGESQ